jgi:hypothetical protein
MFYKGKIKLVISNLIYTFRLFLNEEGWLIRNEIEHGYQARCTSGSFLKMWQRVLLIPHKCGKGFDTVGRRLNDAFILIDLPCVRNSEEK